MPHPSRRDDGESGTGKCQCPAQKGACVFLLLLLLLLLTRTQPQLKRAGYVAIAVTVSSLWLLT